MTPKTTLHPALLLVITALLWSMGGAFIKAVTWNPLAIAGARSAIAAVYLYLALGRPRIRLSWPLFCAAMSLAVTMILFVTATRLTTAANAVFLQYLAPVFVAVFAPRFLGEPTLRRDWIAMLVAFSGMTLFFWGEVSVTGQLGNALALCSSLTFAGLPLFLRKMKGGNQAEALLLGNIVAAACCLPFYFQGPFPDIQGVGALLILGVVQIGVAYQVYARAIPHVRAIEASLIPVIEPILNPVWVFLFIGERPSSLALMGGLVVVGAATMQGVMAARFRPKLP